MANCSPVPMVRAKLREEELGHCIPFSVHKELSGLTKHARPVRRPVSNEPIQITPKVHSRHIDRCTS